MTAADEDRREEAKERRLERLRHLHAQAIELTNATAAFEHAALAPPMLLNGGALVAVLALLGTENFGALAGHPLSVIAITAWLVGVLASAATTVLGFFSQRAFQLEMHRAIEVEMAEFDGNMEKVKERLAERHRLGGVGVRHRNIAKCSYVLSMSAFLLGAILAFIVIGRST